MASTWGSNTWSSNSFGSDNNIISVTGIGATFSLGDESSQANADVIPTSLPITLSSNLDVTFDIGAAPGVSGFGTTFNLGAADAGPDAMVTGLDTVTASVGTVDAYNLEGWGRQQWNTFAWGITGSLLTTGEQANANLGSIADVTGTASVDLTGIQLTADLGTVLEIIAVEVPVTGINLTSNLGTADAGPDAMVTGLDTVTASVGSVEAYNLEGWGRYFWGQFEWGATGEWEFVPVTGISLSASLGNEIITADANLTLTGFGVTAAEGVVDPSPDATVTGIGFTADLSIGTVTIADANTDVTGEAMTASLGNETITGTANLTLTGFGITAEEGTVDPAPDATVTGIGFSGSLAIGTVVIGEANVTVVGEGFAAGLGVGNLDAVTLADVTGIAMSANLGSVTITAEATTNTTGIGLTMALGTNRTLIWNQVNTGTAPTWTEVDTAA